MGKVVMFPGKRIESAKAAHPAGKGRRQKVTDQAGRKPIISVESDVESSLPRDQWDRPKIILPDGSGKVKAYRRPSTIADVLDNKIGLNKWLRRLEAEGLAARPDLIAAVQAATTSKEIGEIVEDALEYAGANNASRQGSAFHAISRQYDETGEVPQGLAPNLRAMLDAYIEAVHSKFEVIDCERFVVQDTIQAAGTYDRRLKSKASSRYFIGDIKTGQSLEYLAVDTPAQVSIYAASKLYDIDGNREPLDVERDWGLLIHVPWVEKAEHAECNLYWLDLAHGRKVVRESLRAEGFQKIKAKQVMLRHLDGED